VVWARDATCAVRVLFVKVREVVVPVNVDVTFSVKVEAVMPVEPPAPTKYNWYFWTPPTLQMSPTIAA